MLSCANKTQSEYNNFLFNLSDTKKTCKEPETIAQQRQQQQQQHQDNKQQQQ